MDKYISIHGKNKRQCMNTKHGTIHKSYPHTNPKYLLKVCTPFAKYHSYENATDKEKRQWHDFINGCNKNSKPVISNLFSSYTFYFDGFLGQYTRLELVNLVRMNGGYVERFYSPSKVSIIIAKNLNYAKMEEYKKKPAIRVIDPQWILDSIKEKKLQPFTQYSLTQNSKSSVDHYFNKLKED